jgi:hypothetical protein
VEAREEASVGGVRRDGRDAMAAETASGDGGGGLGPRRLRRKRCGVRRDRVENGTWPEMDAGAAAGRSRQRRSVAIAAAGGRIWVARDEGIFHRQVQEDSSIQAHSRAH